MQSLTHWLLFHIVSGHAFFTGAACLLLAVGLSTACAGRWRRSARNLLALLGGLLAAVSATPLPPVLYAVLIAASVLWILGMANSKRLRKRAFVGLRVAAVLAWTLAVLVELPNHRKPQVPPMGQPVLGVIGDSVTAGIGEQEAVTWPVLLAETHGVVIRDHSRMGATVASALGQAESLTEDERLVILEIGGNDILGTTTPAEFEAGLELLLQAVRRPGRIVVMLELPLPPTYNRYGRIQRRLARTHGVLLAPKRVLAGVLLQADSTLDSIHLSQAGHQQLAERMWGLIHTAYANR
jgi:acyl-CoA thioesterase I